MTAYAALAEPSRRRILDLLRAGERSVNDLVTALELSQPGVSKHLKVCLLYTSPSPRDRS